MKHVDADNNFVHFAFVKFKVVGFKREMNKNGVRFVHINDFDAIFGKDDVGFQENIFEGGHESAEGGDLEGLDGENIFGINSGFVGSSGGVRSSVGSGGGVGRVRNNNILIHL
jgi:hypothetical protein